MIKDILSLTTKELSQEKRNTNKGKLGKFLDMVGNHLFRILISSQFSLFTVILKDSYLLSILGYICFILKLTNTNLKQLKSANTNTLTQYTQAHKLCLM